jgi:hypothetical protein
MMGHTPAVSTSGPDPSVAGGPDRARELSGGTGPLPVTPAGRADPSHTFAIVVGIDRYPSFGDLAGACADAGAFRDWLVHPQGGNVPTENLRLRLSAAARDVRDAEPIKIQIDRDLDQFVAAARQATVPSRLYLYFAGHGIAPLRSTAAGVMANALRNPKECWNLAFDTYFTWLRRCADFAEVVLFSDCCRSLSDAEAGAPQHDVCRRDQRAASFGPQRYLVVHGADVNALSYEREQQRGQIRGTFTTVLLEGLWGAAASRSGSVDATTLKDFVQRAMPARSGGRQIVEVADSDSPVVLATGLAPERWTFTVTLSLVTGSARELRIRDSNFAVVETVVVEPDVDVASVRLANGPYLLEDAAIGSKRFRVDGRDRAVDATTAEDDG